MLKGLLPTTYQKLRGQKKNVVAAISLGCIGGFFIFIPAILEGITTPTGVMLISVAFATLLFFIAALGIVSNILGIAGSLFQDYANHPSYVHWFIISIFVIGVLTLSLIKIVVALKSEKVISGIIKSKDYN